MSIASTVFVRVTAQDRQRGYQLLAGFDSKIVVATATRVMTLNGTLTREQLNTVIAKVAKDLNASEVRDVTAAGIQVQLRKLFNEPNPAKVAAQTTAE
jgi:hypothetical protein